MTVPFLDLASMHAPIAAEFDEVWSRVTEKNAFIGGHWVETFEKEYAAYIGTTHAIGCANGTDALELILRGLEIGPGDEVIIPANTFIATAEAVVAAGASPVFVDCDPETLLITAESIEAAATPRTAAVMVVHLYGQPAALDSISEVCDKLAIALIEDAAQAHGAEWDDKRAGSWGVAAGFSFYPGKNLGAFGDGGAITTNDGALDERIRSIAFHGRSVTSRYHHDNMGMNSRLDGLQAGILSVKLRHLDGWNVGRQAARDRYEAGLTALPLVKVDERAKSVHHLCVVQSGDREALMSFLAERGIGTGIHYPVPCHLNKPFKQWAPEVTPVVSEQSAPRIMSLPMFPALTNEMIDYTIEAIHDFHA
ncbi:MAG: DegT/DnrJ/EryC1/StrS family aminotransferase [Acidimicrobiales bacterium]